MGSTSFGFAMAVLGSFFAGASMVLQKVGVQKSRQIWLLGLVSLVLGELLTVVAYTNAPAILVSPLGALRVIVTTLLSVKYLKEQISQSTKVFKKFFKFFFKYFKRSESPFQSSAQS